MGEGISYREFSNWLVESKEALGESRVKYKASLAKRRKLAKQLYELSESSSSEEANMDALVNEAEKLNDDKSNLRREIEALTIRMSQELEARRTVEDKIREKENEIFKLNQEVGTLTAYLQEKKEVKADLDMAMSLRERLMKKNQDLTKELVDANELLFKFNKRSTILDEKIQSQRQKGETQGLGYTTFQKGDSSDTKNILHEEKFAPKTKVNTDSSATRFGSYKEKSLEVHSEFAKPVIAKKVRKEVEQFAISQGFTKEAIVEAREMFEEKKVIESSSAPTSTSTDRQTRSAIAKEKPSSIQFKRKGKEVKPPTPKALEATDKRKKEQAKRTTDEEETKFEGEKKELRASGNKSTVVGASTMKSVKKPVTKLNLFENVLYHIKKYGIMVDVKKLYDNFGEDEQRQIEDVVVLSMNKFSKALIELQEIIPNSLYNKLEER
ncbi:uncharacterized protein LOC131876670 [Cryptomeria japonica]|uniref:uncharacterized protein LOC131876670 n=1 Tax=Cryptomeria japonica TaxID=3369 RepID=UPI0027DA425E|nr:uncharacterized protein LOC131876670 [Cryptomeria japonica]